MTEHLISLFERDLARLRSEILLYTTDVDLWLNHPGINNSAGNLALHITGNLRHFIGAVLGDTGYQRDRYAEFHEKNVSRKEIISRINRTLHDCVETLRSFPESRLEERYPLEVLGYPMSTAFFLIHLHGHLNYHLGQINYHRRILTAPDRSIDM